MPHDVTRFAPSAALTLLLAAGLALGHEPDQRAGPAEPEPGEQVRYDGQMVLRATARTHEELDTLLRHATEVWSCHIGLGTVDVQVTPEGRAAIDRAGIPARVWIPDVQARLDEDLRWRSQPFDARAGTWYDTYHDLAEFDQHLTDLATAHPTMVGTLVAGASLQGRTIRGIRFSAPDLPGNPRGSRRVVLINGGQHAREWVNPATAMYVADEMLERYPTDPRIQDVLSRVEIILIPILNPDGYVHTWNGVRLWRKNRRANGDGTFGVDLNRNWGYQWGGEGSSTSGNSETFRGLSAFSEPETASVRDFILSEPRIVAHIDFHSYSQLILSPWGYTSLLPANAALYEALNDRLADGIEGVHSLRYTAGPAYTTIYPASGTMPDWMWGDRGAFSWTIELRDQGDFGFVLPPDQIRPTAEENFEGVLRLCEFVGSPVRVYPSVPAPANISADPAPTLRVKAESNAGTLDPSSVRVHWREQGSGGFTSAALPLLSGSTYQGTVAGLPCGGTIEYYFSAADFSGATSTYPPYGELLVAGTGNALGTFHDDASSDLGWSFSAPTDTATTGRWERAAPTATNYQPGSDADANGLCFVTDGRGGTDGQYDVDGGATTLTSPILAAVAPPGAAIRGVRLGCSTWFATSTSPGDSFDIAVSPDNGATWTQVYTQTTSAPAWQARSIPLPASCWNSTQIRLRFRATDGNAGSLVEAGVDAVTLIVDHCPRSADLDDGSATGTPDGGVTIEDLIFYLSLLDAGDTRADFDNDLGVSIEDLILYLEAFDRGI